MVAKSNRAKRQLHAMRSKLASGMSVQSSAPFLESASESLLDTLQLSPHAGGIAFICPSAAPISTVDALLGSPDVDAVQVCGEKMTTWKTSPDELVVLCRQISRTLRAGRTAAVHLDSHVQGVAEPTPDSSRPFICSRLAQVVPGLADEPTYIVAHGDEMAQMLVNIAGADNPPVIGSLDGDVVVYQFGQDSYLAGVPLAVVPGRQAATSVVQAVNWFEARRQLS